MVIGIIGESCTGKSTLAGKLRTALGREIVTGKDHLRMAKSESEATALFRQSLVSLMEQDGYRLIDEHEHEFINGEMTVAFAAPESLPAFAEVDVSRISVMEEDGVRFLLPELADFLKVYEASSKDGYRRDVKNKQDLRKIGLIRGALEEKRKLPL